MSKAVRYVILGGGITGTTAAEEIRKADATAEITLIEQETHPLYSRVLLPHYVKGQIPREKVFLKQPNWYHDNNIEFMSGVRVLSIDAKNKFLATSEGREIPFDKLLLATGSEVNLAPHDIRGTAYLHTLDDAEQLTSLIREIQMRPKEDRHAAVYGGGFIALEFINIFAHFGFTQTVIMRGNGFWSKVLSPEAQAILATRVEKAGITLVTNEEGLTLLGEHELRGVRLNDGREVPAYILGVGIGTHTDTELFADAGLMLAGGIVANEQLETNAADVYTAGDAAEFPHPLIGRRIQLGNWLNAQMQGRAVAKIMRGTPENYNLLTGYSTTLLGLPIAFIGDTSKQHAELVRHSEGTESMVDLYVRDGRIVGAVLIGDMKDRGVITKAIQERKATV